MVGRNLDTLNLDTVELVCMSVAAAELRVRLAALERIKLRASAVVEDHRSRHAAGGSAELQARLAALERVGERAQAVRAFGAACGGGPSSPPPAPAPAPTPAARGQDERLGSAAKKLVHEQVADLLEEDETNLPFLLRLLHGLSALRGPLALRQRAALLQMLRRFGREGAGEAEFTDGGRAESPAGEEARAPVATTLARLSAVRWPLV